MSENKRSRLDLLLDLLAEEVAERLKPREAKPPAPPSQSGPEARRDRAPELLPEPERGVEPEREPEPPPGPRARPEGEPEPEAILPPSPPGSSHAARLMTRLAAAVLALVVVINIPINRHGTTLATAMPDRRSLVIQDGLVVKEEDDAEIYVYQDGRFRWISSLDAFEQYGFTWGDVHIVKDGFLEPFEIGPPLHIVLKCRESPHIYRLEGDKKRWIVDIETFEAEGHLWEDVRFMSCRYLRNLPDGKTIPPGHGPPPQP